MSDQQKEQLASIQQVLQVDPIEGADRIERVQILGWSCVCRKGQFKQGDLVVFVTIDTLIPKWLLSDNREDTEIVRLRTVKMRKQISSGLVLPISILSNYGLLKNDEDGRLYLEYDNL